MGKARDLATLLNSSGQITSAKIGDGEVTAGDLASTLNLTGKSVTLPAGVGGKVIGMSSITYDETPNNYSGQNNFGVGTIYYIAAAKRSVSYTKQSASSTLLVFFNYSYRTNGSGSGLHSMCVYADQNPTSIYKNMLFDIQRTANACGGGAAYSACVPFTGLAAGNYTFNVVPCRRTNDPMSHGINGYSSSDQSDCATWIYIVEVL
jgi:hypothetical protein